MNRWNNLIDLKGDSAPMEVINQRILSDATIEGTNLIVLVMAIMIACIGLNLNSVAVIIGAMLISPLMGGIVATGYGMATYDVPFIRKSLIKLSFQVGLAVLTASIYFLLSPLTSPILGTRLCRSASATLYTGSLRVQFLRPPLCQHWR